MFDFIKVLPTYYLIIIFVIIIISATIVTENVQHSAVKLFPVLLIYIYIIRRTTRHPSLEYCLVPIIALYTHGNIIFTFIETLTMILLGFHIINNDIIPCYYLSNYSMQW